MKELEEKPSFIGAELCSVYCWWQTTGSLFLAVYNLLKLDFTFVILSLAAFLMLISR